MTRTVRERFAAILIVAGLASFVTGFEYAFFTPGPPFWFAICGAVLVMAGATLAYEREPTIGPEPPAAPRPDLRPGSPFAATPDETQR